MAMDALHFLYCCKAEQEDNIPEHEPWNKLLPVEPGEEHFKWEWENRKKQLKKYKLEGLRRDLKTLDIEVGRDNGRKGWKSKK